MKKIFYFLLAVLPLCFMASCDDDNNLPDVDVSITIDGGVRVNGMIYVVQGDTLSVKSINVINREQDKSAIITSATYSWDYLYAGISPVAPFGASFATDNMPLGQHLLQIECPLFAVDKSPANLYMAYKVDIVASADDIPQGEASTVFTDRPGIKEN